MPDYFNRYRERSKPGGTLAISSKLYCPTGVKNEKITYECDGFKVIQNGCNKYDSIYNCTKRYLEMLECDKYSYDDNAKNVHIACEKDGFLLCLIVSKPHPKKTQPSPNREKYRHLWDYPRDGNYTARPPPGHGRIPWP